MDDHNLFHLADLRPRLYASQVKAILQYIDQPELRVALPLVLLYTDNDLCYPPLFSFCHNAIEGECLNRTLDFVHNEAALLAFIKCHIRRWDLLHIHPWLVQILKDVRVSLAVSGQLYRLALQSGNFDVACISQIAGASYCNMGSNYLIFSVELYYSERYCQEQSLVHIEREGNGCRLQIKADPVVDNVKMYDTYAEGDSAKLYITSYEDFTEDCYPKGDWSLTDKAKNGIGFSWLKQYLIEWLYNRPLRRLDIDLIPVIPELWSIIVSYAWMYSPHEISKTNPNQQNQIVTCEELGIGYELVD